MILGLSLPPGGGTLDFKKIAAAAGDAEQAGFDFVLVPDVAALGDDGAKHEAFALVAALAAVTHEIGLVVTASLDFNDPYNLARALATLDHLAHGRAGWRAVTGLSRDEARNFGLDDIAPAAARLARADEMLDVVRGLHDSWDEGAVPRDKASGFFYDRAGMRFLAHAGPAFSVRGPLDVPTAPQRHLPLFCDLEDEDFVVRHADIACLAPGGIGVARAATARLKGRAAVRVLAPMAVAAGTNPAEIADEMAEWVGTDAADGFLVTCADVAWFAAQVMAGLKRARPDSTLRARLGLAPARSRYDTTEICSG